MCYSCKGVRRLSIRVYRRARKDRESSPCRRRQRTFMADARRKEEMDRKRIGTAGFPVGSAATLAATKLFVGVASGSLGVLSSAFDNLADILMSGVNYLSIRKSMEPADSSHPYGHGTIETLGTVFMSVVVALTGIGLHWSLLHGLGLVLELAPVGPGQVELPLSVAASW